MRTVNGVTYDNVRTRILGIERNAESVDYDYGRDEPGDRKDPSGEIVGFGYGSKRSASFTMTFFAEEFEAIEAAARALGKDITDPWPFPVTVSYWDNVKSGDFFVQQANPLHIRTLANAVIYDVSRPHARGAKELVVTVKGKALRVD